MRQWRLTAILLCIATCCLWGAEGALASDSSVRSAIESSARQIKESGELQNALKEFREDPKTLEKLHKGIADFNRIVHKVIVKVSTQKASTSTGERGEREWIGGLQKLSSGFGDLDKALSDIKAHQKTAAKSEIKKAAGLVKAGTAETREGTTLLHVKKS
jgi:hypothetical protein